MSLIVFLISWKTQAQCPENCPNITFDSANRNTFVGNSNGSNVTPGVPDSFSGKSNSFFGSFAGLRNTSGFGNSFFGAEAGLANTTGAFNAFFGTEVGTRNNTGFQNAFFGHQAGFFNTTGAQNCFFGFTTGANNTFARNNSYFGTQAGFFGTTGGENSFFGSSTGLRNITGQKNSYFGTQAGRNNERGSGNVFLGYQAGADEQGSDKLYIANNNTPNPLIYGNFKQGRIGINQGNPQEAFHIKGSDSENNITTLFIEPKEWKTKEDIAQIRLGDPFHFIQVENRIGMTLSDYNGIFFRTGGRNPETQMLIDFDGNIGIGTTEPSAKFHSNGTVRLQNLPSNEGTILTVDSHGNVGTSEIDTRVVLLALDSLINVVSTQAQEIKELRVAMEESKSSTGLSRSAKLYQNTPNPFDQTTEIKCFIPQQADQARLFIYDLQGTQIKKIQISDRGTTRIQLQAGTLKAGMYYYALMIDGQEVAMKRMMITD